MDTIALVENQIDDGQRLLDHLSLDGVIVRAACWVKPADEDRWSLCLVTPIVDDNGPTAAYGQVLRVLRSLGPAWLTDSDIKLLGEKQPFGRDLIQLMRGFSGRVPARLHQMFLGNMAIEEVYVYPPSRPMEILAKGKEEVLRYLEADAQARAATTGEYLLARDQRGALVAVIAGHTFVGSGTVRLGDKSLVLVDGILREVREH
jgi:hypothetical protein